MIAQVPDQALDGFQSAEGIDIRGARDGKVVLLDDAKTKRLLQTAQGDRRTTTMQLPKITVFNAQRAAIN